MTKEQASRRRRARKRKRARQRQGCLGCMTSLLFTLVVCMGVVSFTGNGQAAIDGIADTVQEIALLPQEIATQIQTAEDATQSVQAEVEEVALTAQELRAALEGDSTLFADGITRYYYGNLTDAEKITYLLIAQCVFDMADEVELPTQASTAISDIWPLVRADFPEVFWVDSSLTRTITVGDVQQILFVPTYSLTAAQRAVQEAEIEQVASLYYASIALIENATDYQKVQAAYEFVVGQVSYYENENDQTIYGALAQGQAVCAGYSRAVQYLLNRVGVVCAYVSGEAVSAGEQFTHAWNMVCIEGDYYYLDATWGEDNWDTGVDYSYLCVTAQDLATTHFADASYILPAIEGTTYNYYRVMGAYFENYSAAAVQAAMQLQKGQGYYTLRFADEATAQRALRDLIEEQGIYDILRAIDDAVTGIGYTYKESLYILTIYPQRE